MMGSEGGERRDILIGEPGQVRMLRGWDRRPGVLQHDDMAFFFLGVLLQEHALVVFPLRFLGRQQ
jgi:hypothetical protein